MKKETKKKKEIKEILKTGLDDFVNLAEKIGLAGIVDYAGGFSIDHPMGDIAVGSGLSGCKAYYNNDNRRLSESVIALFFSMYPQFSNLVQTGEWDNLVMGIGTKIVGYSTGFLLYKLYKSL